MPEKTVNKRKISRIHSHWKSIIQQSENDFKMSLFKLLKYIKQGMTPNKSKIFWNKTQQVEQEQVYMKMS